MTSEVVFLLDVDNTLLDNDGVIDDLRRHLHPHSACNLRHSACSDPCCACRTLLRSCGMLARTARRWPACVHRP